MRTITTDEVITKLKEIREARGGETNPSPSPEAYVDGWERNEYGPFEGCYYTTDIGENCVAATCLVDFGLTIPGWDDEENTNSIDHLVRNRWFIQEDETEFEDEATNLLRAAQKEADKGNVWGRAISLALYEKGYEKELDLSAGKA